MVDINDITSVNAVYIFLKVDGKEDRQKAKKETLQELLWQAENGSHFYNRMVEEMRLFYDIEKQKADAMPYYSKEEMQTRNIGKYIDMEMANDDFLKVNHAVSGMCQMMRFYLDKWQRYERLTHEIKTALKKL